ncbi:MAG TPA: hypothetical protein PLR25_12330 [Planctomycetaceae bacterium]|nr:hypothetical protein [Planctomycetaceae bacterium]
MHPRQGKLCAADEAVLHIRDGMTVAWGGIHGAWHCDCTRKFRVDEFTLSPYRLHHTVLIHHFTRLYPFSAATR